MPERLDDFEHDGAPERPVRGVQVAFDHHPLGEVARRQLAVDLKMTHANVGDLALLEETVADHVPRPLLLGIGEKDDRRIDMREVVLGLRNLRLLRRYPTMDFGALVLQ